MMRAAVLLCAALLAGCGSVQTVRVAVPVPVECKETIVSRPVMPTEALSPGVPPFILLRAALSEIDRREAYEVLLRTALVACTAPIK